MTAVSTVPASTPRRGLENARRMFVNSGTSASGFHCRAHAVHTEHQNRKAHQDGADIFLFLIFQKYDKDNANHCEDGGK